MKLILVTTSHRGVFFGYVSDSTDLKQTMLSLMGARMAIRWGTTGGVAELAATGPTAKSKLGSKCDIEALHGITGVWSVTPVARKALEEVP